MKLKAILDNLDGVDEALKPAYTEKDGKFVLNIEGYDSHPEVQGLKRSLQVSRDEKKAIETQLGEMKEKFGSLPDEFNMEEYNRLKDGGGGDVNQKLADQRARLEDASKKALDVVNKKLEDATSKLNKLHVDSALNSGITEIAVAAPFAPAVRAMFNDKVKVDYEGGEPIVTIENMPVNEYLKTWAGTDFGKHYIVAPGSGGGGSGGSGGGTPNKADNPWSKEGFNLTKQTEIERDDPAKAAQLKASAGK
ncbi:hypothetical protein [Dyadobacter bucti]|uniref:hypothetical protein n=1 Tax=Dyadobacter bucti TaxID=2572203 RepID=UPI00110948C5|nr:hypothetical protein [Dyadobacter bucti]